MFRGLWQEGLFASLFPLTFFKQMKGGCCIAVSNTAIIVGMFNELKGHTSAGCNANVTELAKYLKSQNA
jgi:hypothetical protein